MIILRLALLSLRNRWPTALLTLLGIAVSVALLLGVEKVRVSAHDSFASTISGTDVIVGARGGDVQILLYSVFRIGNASNDFTWQSYQDIAARPEVAWIVPLALGDSFQGFRVLGTSADYFQHYQYGGDRSLAFAQGGPFSDLFDAVLGSDVAAAFGYKLGDQIVVSHGIGAVSFEQHADKPFKVVGILKKTGTPVDRTVHISMEAIEAIHVGWENGVPPPAGQEISAADVRKLDLTPTQATAALVGLKTKLDVLSFQRWVNDYMGEPLTAVLPGVALEELWSVVGVAEQALLVVSAMVVATALLGMVTAILSTLNERRREMAILRSVGARPAHVMGLLVAEAGTLAIGGAIAGVVLLYAGLAIAGPWLQDAYGITIDLAQPAGNEPLMLLLIVVAGFVVGLVPAWRAYRTSLADGLIIRV